MLRDQLRLIEGGNPAAAGGTSIPKAATVHEAEKTRCQSPLPTKIQSLVVGEAKGEY
ncbi:hypothetical protein DBIPINDM_007954 (plasmid) [Mesorhizobium sp. AR02]|uniref:hypothetical protein n=1 Tax=Mesorhizobium sp. AR02 TaxID=2865837 RepID=UPI00215E9FB9|nr:hypothetical protein [Mesorhizobium sp. AR02]UVK49865.1 hypothetical protein DBIPINDM_007954 [Mesorhizobium sp. AR02]